MTPEQFVFWLRGYLRALGEDAPKGIAEALVTVSVPGVPPLNVPTLREDPMRKWPGPAAQQQVWHGDTHSGKLVPVDLVAKK